MFKTYKNYLILAFVLVALVVGYKTVAGIFAFFMAFFVSNEVKKREDELRHFEENINKYEKEIKKYKESSDEKKHQVLEETERDLDQWLDKDL
jgi:Na+/phosphate symporter